MPGAVVYEVVVRNTSTQAFVVDTFSSTPLLVATLAHGQGYVWNVNSCIDIFHSFCSGFAEHIFFRTP